MVDRSPYILLVDDDPANLILLEALLQAQGYSTRSATSGVAALAIAQAAPPHLILLDVMMPEMDGFEVCRQLRLDQRLQTIPIIFLTALADDQSRIRAFDSMGDDYFTKPINHQLLLAKISNTLRLKQLRETQRQVMPAHNLPEPQEEQLKRQAEAAWRISEALSEKFRLFVPEQLLSRIAPKGVESIQVGNATEEEVTVLFCDIRGFTAISESQAANETFDWLNAFFTQMHRVIKTHHGFVDKYLGDAVMAVFDRPLFQANDALEAAIMMGQTLNEFNRNHTRFKLKEPIKIGIGIHTGRAIIGTLGSEQRMDSTVIGDVVNTAARLESLTKFYGCQVLISEAVIDRLSDPQGFFWRWIDCTAPRGKQQLNNLYEVLGTPTITVDEAKLRSRVLFEQGIQSWRQNNPTLALSFFQQVIEQNPFDQVAIRYVERCQELIHNTQQSQPAQPLHKFFSDPTVDLGHNAELMALPT